MRSRRRAPAPLDPNRPVLETSAYQDLRRERPGTVVIAARSERPAPASVDGVTRRVILPAILDLLCSTERKGST